MKHSMLVVTKNNETEKRLLDSFPLIGSPWYVIQDERATRHAEEQLGSRLLILCAIRNPAISAEATIHS
jgi:hypothetical protein